jgi:hypothetical protein
MSRTEHRCPIICCTRWSRFCRAFHVSENKLFVVPVSMMHRVFFEMRYGIRNPEDSKFEIRNMNEARLNSQLILFEV